MTTPGRDAADAPTARPGRGRPSVAARRQGDILNAYLDVLADEGMVAVPVRAVAARAGVSRTAVAHFVGDRHEVHLAAVRELQRRYEAGLRAALGATPSPRALVDVLFGEDWVRTSTVEDRALDHYLVSAVRDPALAEAVRAMYRLLTDELRTAIRRQRPAVPAAAAEGCAYAVVCLAEANVTLQRLGFPGRRSRDARAAALTLLAAVLEDS